MLYARRSLLIAVFAIAFGQVGLPREAQSQGNLVDKSMAKGYDHLVGFGPSYIPGQWNPPFGTIQVTQTTGKVGKPGAPGVLAFIDAVCFSGPTSAIEVVGLADAAGTVTPTSTSFSTPGKVNVALEGIAVYYEFDSLTQTYNVVGADFGTIYISSTLAHPVEIANVRERSTYSIRSGLEKHSLITKSDLKGRFGYNPAGTISVWFDGLASTLVVPEGTQVTPDVSRMGLIQSGIVFAQK